MTIGAFVCVTGYNAIMDLKTSPQKGIPRMRKCKPSREHLRHKCPVQGCPAIVINLRKNHFNSCHRSGPMYVSEKEWDQLYHNHIVQRKAELQKRRMGNYTSDKTQSSNNFDINTALCMFTEWMKKPLGGFLAESTAANYLWMVRTLLHKVSANYDCENNLTQTLKHLKVEIEKLFEKSDYSAKYLHNYISALKKFCTFCENHDILKTDMIEINKYLEAVGKYYSRMIENEHFNSQNISKRIESSLDPEIIASTLKYLDVIGFTKDDIDKFKAGSTTSQLELNSLYCMLRNILIFRLICTNGKRGMEVINMTTDEFERRVVAGGFEVCHVSILKQCIHDYMPFLVCVPILCYHLS